MATDRSTVHRPDLNIVAGNGLVHRRMFLMAGTTAAVAGFLDQHPQVRVVHYPGFASQSGQGGEVFGREAD